MIKIWFTDFWNGFDRENNFFIEMLSKHFDITLDPKPDLLIHSVFGIEYRKYNCFRLSFTGENTRPDFKLSDFHIGFDHISNENYLRWPLFLLYYPPERLLMKNLDLVTKKTRFCSFVVSNSEAKERIDFFHLLNSKKKVDSGGRYLNNIGGPVNDKISFIKESHFNIAFENSSYPGYSTEKIYESFLARTIPIYWGNPLIATDFNPKSFINAHDFSSFQALADYVITVEEDRKLYNSYLSESPFIDDIIPSSFSTEIFIDFFKSVFAKMSDIRPVSSSIKNRIRSVYYRYNDRKGNVNSAQ